LVLPRISRALTIFQYAYIFTNISINVAESILLDSYLKVDCHCMEPSAVAEPAILSAFSPNVLYFVVRIPALSVDHHTQCTEGEASDSPSTCPHSQIRIHAPTDGLSAGVQPGP